MLLEREEQGEEGRKRHINMREKHYWLSPVHIPTGGQTHNLGMCPDQELNPRTLGYGTTLQPPEPYWPGSEIIHFLILPLKSVNRYPRGLQIPSFITNAVPSYSKIQFIQWKGLSRYIYILIIYLNYDSTIGKIICFRGLMALSVV